MTQTFRYVPPDFSVQRLASAPAARTVAAERDGVLPDGFFATTNLPTYVKGADGRWTIDTRHTPGSLQTGQLPKEMAASGIAGSDMMALFSSHPPMASRIAALQSAT